MQRIARVVSHSLRPDLLALVALVVAARGAAGADPATAREPRTVPAFHAVELAGTLAVEVTLGKPTAVEVVGEPALLAQVTTTVRDGVLVIDTHGKLPRQHHLRARVSAPDVDGLRLTGTGALAAHGISNPRLAVRVPGTGAVVLDGTTAALDLVLDGTGQVDAERLAARVVTIDVTGTGNAAVHASEALDARVSGTGSIDVTGKPARVKRQVTGVGDIHVE